MEETASTTSSPTTTIGNASAALAAVDSSPTTPTTESPATDSTPAAATAPPVEQTQTPESATPDAQKGEPPKWRWQDILANARETSAKEAEARIRQELDTQYAGLQDFATLSADERAGLAVWHRALRGDAEARSRIAMAAQHNPQLAATLQGLIAAQQPSAPDPEPEPDLQTGDGMLVYSAQQQKQRDEWLTRQITASIEKKVTDQLMPLQRTAQAMQQMEAHSQASATVMSAWQAFTSSNPEFTKDHHAAVAAEIQQDPRLHALADREPGLALETAWARVYRTRVLPQHQKQLESQVVANLQQRAVAGTNNPASASPSAPKSTLGNARAALEAAHASLGG